MSLGSELEGAAPAWPKPSLGGGPRRSQDEWDERPPGSVSRDGGDYSWADESAELSRDVSGLAGPSADAEGGGAALPAITELLGELGRQADQRHAEVQAQLLELARRLDALADAQAAPAAGPSHEPAHVVAEIGFVSPPPQRVNGEHADAHAPPAAAAAAPPHLVAPSPERQRRAPPSPGALPPDAAPPPAAAAAAQAAQVCAPPPPPPSPRRTRRGARGAP